MLRRSLGVSAGVWIALVVSLDCAAGADAEVPLDQLGRLSNWHLSFANDPYNDPAWREISPRDAARALLEKVRFPHDGDEQEKALLERFHAIKPDELPSSLQAYVRKQFKNWNAQTGHRLRFRLVKPDSAAVVLPYRRDETIYVPVAAIGRDWLRAVRDGSTLFRLFMWSLSHPQYSERRASKHSDEFWLTGACELGFPGDPAVPCGGRQFYRSIASDIPGACGDVERKFSANILATLSAAVDK